MWAEPLLKGEELLVAFLCDVVSTWEDEISSV